MICVGPVFYGNSYTGMYRRRRYRRIFKKAQGASYEFIKMYIDRRTERIRWNDAKREALEEARIEVRSEVEKEVRLEVRQEVEQEFKEAKDKAYKDGCTASAKRFKEKGLSLDLIAECTGLPLIAIEAI